MRRWMVVLAVVLLVLAGVGIAVGAFHAGENHGVAEGLSQAGQGVRVVRVEGPRGFFPFGLFLFPLFLFGIFFLFRAAFWGSRWRGYGPGPGGPGSWRERERMLDEWHRSRHEDSGSGTGAGGEPATA